MKTTENKQLRKLTDHPHFKNRGLNAEEYESLQRYKLNNPEDHFKYTEEVEMPDGSTRFYWSLDRKRRNGMKFVTLRELTNGKKAMYKYSLKWVKKNPLKRNEYMRKQRSRNRDFAVKQIILSRIYQVLNNYRNYKPRYHFGDLLKLGWDENYFNILKRMKDDAIKMYETEDVQLDHLIPISLFRFVNDDGSKNYTVIKKAFGLDNLQFIPKKVNIKKRNNITQKAVELLKDWGIKPNV